MNETAPDNPNKDFPSEQNALRPITLATETNAPLPMLNGQVVAVTSADEKLTLIKVLRDMGIVVLMYVLWFLGIGVFVIFLKTTLSRAQFGTNFAIGIMGLQTIAYGIIAALGRQSAGARTLRLFTPLYKHNDRWCADGRIGFSTERQCRFWNFPIEPSLCCGRARTLVSVCLPS